MDHQALAQLLFPQVTETPDDVEAKFPLRELPEGAVVTRMAPSPTGFVHLGNLVQGMISERMAHQSGGVLFLRVEDTDAKREVPGAVEFLRTMKEKGYDVQMYTSRGFAMKAGTDPQIIEYWSDVIGKVVEDPEFLAEAEGLALPIVYKNYVDFAEQAKNEMELYAQLVAEIA